MKEIEQFRKFEVFVPHQLDTLPVGTQVVSSRFVCTLKDTIIDDAESIVVHTTPRARLVALGYMEDVSGDVIDAPTACRESTRLVSQVAAQFGWAIKSYDVSSALLQSDQTTK